jgi:hypothetical protein
MNCTIYEFRISRGREERKLLLLAVNEIGYNNAIIYSPTRIFDLMKIYEYNCTILLFPVVHSFPDVKLGASPDLWHMLFTLNPTLRSERLITAHIIKGLSSLFVLFRARGGVVVEALCYKPEPSSRPNEVN